LSVKVIRNGFIYWNLWIGTLSFYWKRERGKATQKNIQRKFCHNKMSSLPTPTNTDYYEINNENGGVT
jgi:hypothetical protein